MYIKALVFGVCFMAMGAQAWAGTHDPRVNARQHYQQHRIVQGVKSGELTRGEAKSLTAEQIALRKKERLYKSDGTLTKQERLDLHKDLTRSSIHIYHNKHDAQSRP